MKLHNGLAMLEINIQGFGLNPTLIWDEDSAVLIDTGMPGQLELVRHAMLEVGVTFDRLTAVILTHQDLDHIGGLPELLEQIAHPITVYAHAIDKPYIEGEQHLLKTDPAKMSRDAWDKLPEQMKQLYANPPKAKVDRTVEDGQELLLCGGIQVVHTPGHTPGHISLYLKQWKTLIAGDAMVAANGMLREPYAPMTPDMEAARQSIAKLRDFDIEAVICYHGGLSNKDVKKQLEALSGN